MCTLLPYLINSKAINEKYVYFYREAVIFLILI